MVQDIYEDVVWHESLVFLFEKLSEHKEMLDWLFDTLFDSKKQGHSAVLLAAEILVDLHSGLSKGKKTGKKFNHK